MSNLTKKQKEYEKEYGDIPEEETERMSYLLSILKFKEKELPFIDKMFDSLKYLKTETQRFTLYLVPEPCPRPRMMKKNHRFYVKGARENHQLFYDIIHSAGDVPLITTPTEIKLINYLPIPKSMNRFEKYFAELGLIKPVTTPDWDNLAKTYCDMIQKNILFDDKLIWNGQSIKLYSIKPRIELEIKYAVAYDCRYNRNRIESSKSYIEEDKKRFYQELETILDRFS